MLDVACQCGTQFKLADEWSGRQVKCPACGAVFTIGPAAPLVAIRPPAAVVSAPAPVPVSAATAPSLSHRPAALEAPLWQTLLRRCGPVARGLAHSQAARWAAVGTLAVVVVMVGGLVASRRPAGIPPSVPGDTGVSAAREPVPETKRENEPQEEEQPDNGQADSNLTHDDSAARAPSYVSDEGVPVSLANAAPTPRLSPVVSDAPKTTNEGDAAPPPVRTRKRRERRPGDVSGVSRNYDDLHCQLLQSKHGARVPPAATIIEIDGDRLPLANPAALASSRAAVTFLPRGRHAVRFRTNESLIALSVDGAFLDEYQAMRDFFKVGGGGVRDDELLSRSARALDSHAAPMLLNLMGAAQAAKEQWSAAERKFRRSLRVNPCFSPAHLNLAWCLERRGAKDEAARELRLAAMFNVGNVFGLAAPIHELARKLGVAERDDKPLVFDPAWYLAAESGSLSDEDRRLTALLVSVSKYAPRETERAKILNNLGAHFADSGRAELALEHYRSALTALKLAGAERFGLAREVLTHMSDACRAAGLEEADEYERMRTLVSP